VNLTRDQLEAYRRDPALLIAEQFYLPTGATYGQAAAPFQVALFNAVFARNIDGTPRHRLLYDQRRRGESKTEDLAAVGLADVFVGPKRHRSYAIAADQDQALLILDAIGGLVDRSPLLGGQVDVLRSTVRNRATKSELRVISADDRTAFGIRPYRALFDELSLQLDARLWNVIWSSIGKSPASQLVAMSMAGWDFDSIGWKVREVARGSAAYYFASREGTELAPWLSPRDYEEQRLTLHPSDFARFWECRWTEPRGSWITREMYDACAIGTESLRGDRRSRYVGFVDVGLVHDPTAVAVVHREGERVVLDTLATLQGSRNEPVELEVLEQLVTGLTDRFGVREWLFEAPQAVASVQRLQKRLSANVEARYPTADTQARLFGTLYQLFANRRLVLFPHEQLRKEALSLVIRTVGGRLKVVESSAVHQDHVVALGGAADLLLAQRVTARMPLVAGRGVRDQWLRPPLDSPPDSGGPRHIDRFAERGGQSWSR
jgi:Phage Terminase